MLCKTIGGNPLPSLTWYRNDVPLNEQYKTFEDSTTVESQIVRVVTAADNKAKYRCEAKNAALEKPKNKTIIMKVQCEYYYYYYCLSC